MKFEYKMIPVNPEHSVTLVEKELNSHGAEEWELVNFQFLLLPCKKAIKDKAGKEMLQEVIITQPFFCFKRPLP